MQSLVAEVESERGQQAGLAPEVRAQRVVRTQVRDSILIILGLRLVAQVQVRVQVQVQAR